MKQLIPDDIIEATGMSENELKIEIAVQLFKLKKLPWNKLQGLQECRG